MKTLRGFLACACLFVAAPSYAAYISGSGSGLPAGGTVNDCILNTAPGTGTWQTCPGAGGGDDVSVDGAAVVNPNFDSAGDIDFVNTANVITANVKANSVEMGTDTTGNYAAGDGEAGNALSGDSATAFFSSGTIEDARLPTSMADKLFTGSLNIPNGAAPTTDAFGEIAGDNNAWAASRGAPQWFDGTANTYLIGVLASDTPSNGECPKWNTGGTITWESCTGGGGDVATDAIWDAKGDLAGGTGANTAARLAIGTNGHVLTADSAEVTGMKWAAPGAATIVHTFQALTTSDTISGTHKFVTCDATGGAVAITLPAANAVAGADFQIKKIDSSANTCTVTRAGADTIDTATTAVLTRQHEEIGIAADGTSAWRIF